MAFSVTSFVDIYGVHMQQENAWGYKIRILISKHFVLSNCPVLKVCFGLPPAKLLPPLLIVGA